MPRRTGDEAGNPRGAERVECLVCRGRVLVNTNGLVRVHGYQSKSGTWCAASLKPVHWLPSDDNLPNVDNARIGVHVINERNAALAHDRYEERRG